MTTKKEMNEIKHLRRYGSSRIDQECENSYRKFAVGYSTERHFRIADHEEPIFCGAYGNVRKELDYSFHEHYRKGWYTRVCLVRE